MMKRIACTYHMADRTAAFECQAWPSTIRMGCTWLFMAA